MSRAFALGLLLCASSACTSFHDSVLSYAETDGGGEADAELAAPPLELDAESAPQDASTAPVDATAPDDAGPALGLDASQAPDAALVDAAEKTCCELLEERWWEMGNKLPFPACSELVCPKLPSHP